MVQGDEGDVGGAGWGCVRLRDTACAAWVLRGAKTMAILLQSDVVYMYVQTI